jgi:predicted enzyme involved in methoxymalonyl-ACP biosynthesis
MLQRLTLELTHDPSELQLVRRISQLAAFTDNFSTEQVRYESRMSIPNQFERY